MFSISSSKKKIADIREGLKMNLKMKKTNKSFPTYLESTASESTTAFSTSRAPGSAPIGFLLSHCCCCCCCCCCWNCWCWFCRGFLCTYCCWGFLARKLGFGFGFPPRPLPMPGGYRPRGCIEQKQQIGTFPLQNSRDLRQPIDLQRISKIIAQNPGDFSPENRCLGDFARSNRFKTRSRRDHGEK